MLEKSSELKLYEKSDQLMDSFRDSVQAARDSARAANVPTVIVIDGITYHAMPDGEIIREDSTTGG